MQPHEIKALLDDEVIEVRAAGVFDDGKPAYQIVRVPPTTTEAAPRRRRPQSVS